MRRPAVLCALPEELAPLTGFARRERVVAGLTLVELDLAGPEDGVLACVTGVGKVYAARAAAILCAEGASALLVAGVCGGLSSGFEPGVLAHCTSAVQSDLWLRAGRSADADPTLFAAWSAVAAGRAARFLTADRAVFHPLRSLRLRRRHAGPCVADMETAAIGVVAASAGVPWAALRAVTDRPIWRNNGQGFRAHFPVQAGRAAETIPALLARLGGVDRSSE